MKSARYPSNWQLSTDRATNVLMYLVQKHGYNPAVLSAAGYGEYRPIATNSTPQGRSKNRRVDLVVLRSKYAEAEPEPVSGE
jgi:chemotaxis protein MotB